LEGRSTMNEKKRVIIVGGGVAGLSAAHELAKFGDLFDVHVIESRTVTPDQARVGGKAVSYPVDRISSHSKDPTTPEGTPPAEKYIAEHGFHMFPHFYRHVTQTMKEIPFRAPASFNNFDGTVWGNLQGCTEAAYAEDGILRTVQRPFPESGFDFVRAVRNMMNDNAPVTDTDIAIYAWLLLKFITSCQERRDEVYEQMTWRDYFGLDRGWYSDAFVDILSTMPQTLSAMRTDQCSARTVCSTSIQLLFDMTGDGGLHMESMLRGSTQKMWLDPWLAHFKRSAPTVKFWPGVTLAGFEFDGVKVAKLNVSSKVRETLDELRKALERGGEAKLGPDELSADYYILAIPLEVLVRILGEEAEVAAPIEAQTSGKAGVVDQPQPVAQVGTTAVSSGSGKKYSALLQFDASLARLAAMDLSRAVAPMTGIQFYLQNDVPICNGHVFYPHTPWALTSVSQAQFWENQLGGQKLNEWLGANGTGLGRNGVAFKTQIGGIFSVIIADWTAPAPARSELGGKGKSARECTVEEVKREVWLQLQDALNPPGGLPILDDWNLWQKSPPEGTNHETRRGEWLDKVLVDACELDRTVIPATGDGNVAREKLRLFDPGDVPRSDCTPLFVHPTGALADRPDAQLRVPNLLLAADYVRTYTDLASMEGANEAARRAVLAILWRESSASDRFPEIWPLNEGTLFDGARALDRLAYTSGKLPHVMDTPLMAAGVLSGALSNVTQFGIDILGLRGHINPPTPMALPGNGLPFQFGATMTTKAVTATARAFGALKNVTRSAQPPGLPGVRRSVPPRTSRGR
jgi:uncharacterized protein with NAD-binding domain and iron-sulfur cluster